MNYKKIGVALIASASLVLAGCGNSAKNMTFQDTYKAFLVSHTSEAVEMFNTLSNSSALAEEGTYTLSGNMLSGAQIHLSVGALSTVVNSGMSTDSTVTLTGDMTQPDSDDVISLDAGIMYKMIANESFVNISKLALTSAKGNPQLSMIGAFSAILTNKWISISASGASMPLQTINLSTLYMLPSQIVTALIAHPIFVEKSKEMVNGNPVYHVAFDQTGLYLAAKDIVATDAVKAFLRDQSLTDADLQNWAVAFVENAMFDGTLTARSKKNVVLTINNLQTAGTEKLQGTVANEKSHFEIQDTTSSGSQIITLDIGEKGGVTTLAVSAPEQMISLQANVNIKKANTNGIAYLLGATFTHPQFTLHMDGNVKVRKTDAIKIEAPTSAVSLESLLGSFGGLVGGSSSGSEMAQ